MSEISDLKEFLINAGVSNNLTERLIEEGLTLPILLEANDAELIILVPKLVDKIKIRAALDKHRNNINNSSIENLIFSTPAFQSSPVNVALPTRQRKQDNIIELLHEPRPSTSFAPDTGTTKETETFTHQDISFPLGTEIEFIESDILKNYFQEATSKKSSKNLRVLLCSDTYGKKIVENIEKKAPLTVRDRALIVKIIVEAELKSLEKLNSTIRKDVWLQWADQISNLFQGENRDLYYVPYKVSDGKIIQASGLIHNRLITHRRSLSTGPFKRRGSNSSSSNESDSGQSSGSSGLSKRVRPLPENFDLKITEDSGDQDLSWLKSSSSPQDILITKWKNTLQRRLKLLESLTHIEYINTFPGLKLPKGYELLTLDFDSLHPGATTDFSENFTIIKIKLLHILTQKGEQKKVDQPTLDLLELASVGEEQANVAALLATITLMRQMPTVSIPRKKVWKLSREEVRSSFLGIVATAADIETFCNAREALVLEKGISHQPYILCVGSSWANIIQYEIVINKHQRYQFPDICSAVKHIYHIYWALDCAYPKDCAPCWMFIQRTMFKMTSKYDTEGVILRELLSQINNG